MIEIVPGVEESGECPIMEIPVAPVGNFCFTLPSPMEHAPQLQITAFSLTWEVFLQALPTWKSDLLQEFSERYDSTDPLYVLDSNVQAPYTL